MAHIPVWWQSSDDLGTAKVETGGVRKDSRQVVESGTFQASERLWITSVDVVSASAIANTK